MKRALSLGGLLLLFATTAYAQQKPVSASIEVLARIMQNISIVGTNNLTFGDIVASASGSTKRIEKTSPDAGIFEVSGGANQPIQVTFNAPSQLRRVDGNGTLDVDLAVYGSSALGNAGSAQQVLQNSVVNLANGRYFFFVGGQLRAGAIANNPPGDYTAEFEMAVSYTGL